MADEHLLQRTPADVFWRSSLLREIHTGRSGCQNASAIVIDPSSVADHKRVWDAEQCKLTGMTTQPGQARPGSAQYTSVSAGYGKLDNKRTSERCPVTGDRPGSAGSVHLFVSLVGRGGRIVRDVSSSAPGRESRGTSGLVARFADADAEIRLYSLLEASQTNVE